jgi:SAM-dependent methyltransferase
MDTLYSESAYYRMLFAERASDVPFYLRVTDHLGAQDDVLELGVGDGRIALPLAAAGRRVTGVDRSESMLAALELRLTDAPAEVRERIAYQNADTRALRLERRFARVICPFNGVAHFHDAAALSDFFATVRAHLAPDGRFALDVMIPDPALLSGGSSSVPWLRHPRTGAVCRLEERYDYDPLSQVLTIATTLIERETETAQTLALSLRQLFPEETALLLAHHGFDILERTRELGDSLAYICAVR